MCRAAGVLASVAIDGGISMVSGGSTMKTCARMARGSVGGCGVVSLIARQSIFGFVDEVRHDCCCIGMQETDVVSSFTNGGLNKRTRAAAEAVIFITLSQQRFLSPLDHRRAPS